METALFITVNSINVLTFLMFISRVHWEKTASVFGFIALLFSIPAFIIFIANLREKKPFFSWFPALVFVAWAVMDIIVDYVYKIEFRNPMRPALLAPFLILFYFSIAGMSFSFWRTNFFYWLISGITCALNLFGAVYALLNGKG
jgi:hypothetical protein